MKKKQKENEIKGYLSNQWGFSETGRILVDRVIQKIRDMDIVVLNPFEECGKELDIKELEKLTGYDSRKKYWEDFNNKVTPINNRLMRQSDCFFAVLDGGVAVDDGVASEIGYYAALYEQGIFKRNYGKIFALRSDLRGGENIGCLVNPQVMGYINQTGGKISVTLDDWLKSIYDWKNEMP